MLYNKETSEREQWFLDRIGKIVYRNKELGEISIIAYLKGIRISNMIHAKYLHSLESEYYHNKIGVIKFFDTPQERDEFENKI